MASPSVFNAERLLDRNWTVIESLVREGPGSGMTTLPRIMASGITITDDDTVYVADYQLREGIVIAKADDFSIIGFIPEALAEGVTVDAAGNVFAGEVLPRNLKKFVKSRAPGSRGGD